MVVDEAAINALVLGERDVPLALVTGDEAVTAQARQRFAGVTTVAVKESISRYSARSIHPDEACKRIRAGAAAAVTAAAQGRVKPYRLPAPIGVTPTSSARARALARISSSEMNASA